MSRCLIKVSPENLETGLSKQFRARSDTASRSAFCRLLNRCDKKGKTLTYTYHPINGTFANRVDPDKMPHNLAGYTLIALSTGIYIKDGNNKNLSDIPSLGNGSVQRV